ncbi:MAG: adenosylcobinamide amidohydrolase [Blautia sp.]|nr:adenosylcobinamide amidohydrolase [Blautia sp.]
MNGCGKCMDNGVKKKLCNNDWVEVKIDDMVLHFSGKRRVLSTSCLNGGPREDLTAVFNHCDMDENVNDCPMYGDTYKEHLEHAAKCAGLDADSVCGLSTAVYMKYVVCEEAHWKDYEVTVYLTGGILENGRRVGDPTSMEERNEIFEMLEDGRNNQDSNRVEKDAEELAETSDRNHIYEVSEDPMSRSADKTAGFVPGTINMIIHISAELSWNAMVGATVVATEAKAAAIQEVGLKSCYSDGLATGSGTDGIIIVSDMESDVHLTQVRTDVKAGEIIGAAVKKALKRALYWNIEISSSDKR